MAEGLLKAAVHGRRQMKVASAGVAAMNGQPMSAETSAILNQKGAGVAGFRSQQVDARLLESADYVIAMTSSHADMVKRYCGKNPVAVNLLCDFIDPGEGLGGADIPDPIGMGMDAYEEVAEVMELAMPGILAALDALGSSE